LEEIIMALFTTSFDSDNISLGPCFVYWKGVNDVSFRHVGHTYGGVSVSITQKSYDLKSDQYGETPVRAVDGGVSIEATVNMTEMTFANLKMMFVTATDQTTFLTFGKPVGGALNFGQLILEPTDGTDVWHLYRAAANFNTAVEVSYTADKQRVFACKFIGMIDDSRTSGDQLFRVGAGYDTTGVSASRSPSVSASVSASRSASVSASSSTSA
jgi:hypothetical protein